MAASRDGWRNIIGMKPTISESGIQDIRGRSISKVKISLRRTYGQMFTINGVVTVPLDSKLGDRKSVV